MPSERNAEAKGRWYRHPITLSTVASVIMICGGIAPVIAYLGRSLLITSLAEAMSEPIQAQVVKVTAPTKDGVQAILQDKIDELTTKIAVLENKQRRDPAHFTDAEAIELAAAKARKDKQEEALAKTQKPPTTSTSTATTSPP